MSLLAWCHDPAIIFDPSDNACTIIWEEHDGVPVLKKPSPEPVEKQQNGSKIVEMKD
ncbi:hypothetical protein C5167_004276 [Papaver somniferum]|nr:hypothetical protein C5167_004276 [Papaver somniferum]